MSGWTWHFEQDSSNCCTAWCKLSNENWKHIFEAVGRLKRKPSSLGASVSVWVVAAESHRETGWGTAAYFLVSVMSWSIQAGLTGPYLRRRLYLTFKTNFIYCYYCVLCDGGGGCYNACLEARGQPVSWLSLSILYGVLRIKLRQSGLETKQDSSSPSIFFLERKKKNGWDVLGCRSVEHRNPQGLGSVYRTLLPRKDKGLQ